jgi:hypothetical protein
MKGLLPIGLLTVLLGARAEGRPTDPRQAARIASNPGQSAGTDGPRSRDGARAPGDRTVLGIQGTRFTLDGKPTFLLGISYYGGLGASDEAVRRDLDDLRRHGFNWLRVWATWSAFDRDVSAVGPDGGPREPFLGRLKWLLAECDRRGLVVDVTLTRGEGKPGGAVPDFRAHRKAVETVVDALKAHRNWYLDLANERDVRDARHVPTEELKALRELARELDPELPVTASFGGRDLDESDLREALKAIGLDFVAPHRPREPESPGQTEVRARATLAAMKEIGRSAPILYQEPFRRGYGRWEPSADDFLADLDGAIAGGAAGWCFHNGSGRGAAADQPRRSFDLRDRRLFEQLDDEERKVVDRAASRVRRADAPKPR